MCLEIFGRLTKKIYCSLLSGVLLFVLFALLQNCYAREVTSYDIANAIYNISYERSVTLTKNDINIAICETISNELNNHQGMYFIGNGGSGFENIIAFYYLLGTRGYIYNNSPNGNQGTKWITYNINNKSFNMNSFETATTMAYGQYTYNDGNLYTSYNPNNNNLYWYGDTMRPNGFDMFAENLFIDDYFGFNYISNLTDIQIEDFNLMKQIPKGFNTTVYVAEFGRFVNLDTTLYKPRYTIWKYQKPQNYFEPIVVYDYNLYSYINDDLGRLYLSGSMLIPNTIIEINLSPTDLDKFSPLSVLFYITDENSVIFTDSTSGKPTIDYSSTFNDDYYKRYSNIINSLISSTVGNIVNPSGDVTGTIDFSPITQGITDINNTLTDGSQTTNIINSYISGDLPDVFGYQENFKTEYGLYWTPLNYLSTQIFNALTLNSTAEFHIPLRNGQTLVLSSDQFFVPEGPLKSFIRLYLVFATIYVVFLSFRRLINNINSGGVNSVLEKQGVDPDYIKM